MSDQNEPSGMFLGLIGGGAIVLCCGLPLLLASGALAALAGIGLGSWLLIAAGVALVVVGVLRRRHRTAVCDTTTERGSRVRE